MTNLTTKDLDDHATSDGWLGFGYTGNRTSGEFDAEQVAKADAFVLATANAEGWTKDDLDLWLNSRDGRHWSDWVMSGGEPTDRAAGGIHIQPLRDEVGR